uniref:Putative glutamate-gated metabotropic ion channel receptor subunit grm2 n=1 Tax=Lutzomyia longipalpis TaxID=7200 RepID=A0A1B0CM31_LUTLO
MARQPAKSAGALLLATLATLVRLTVASSDYFSVSVDTGGDGNRVNLPKFGDRISPRHRYSGEERTSSAAVRANVTHLHRLTANDIIGRKIKIESNVSSAQAHRLEMSTEFFVVPPTVATMKPPSIRGVPTSLAGMIVTARTTAEAAGNATPPTIVPTHTIGLRKEGWVVPVLILSIITMITMVGFEVFVLCKVWRTSPSRRHLFLGQMLLLGLFACAGIAAIVTSRPTVVSCAIIRFGSGVAFALVFASLLVKCVFLISINGGVYLPYPYQGLLLLFAVLIQVAVSAHQFICVTPPSRSTFSASSTWSSSSSSWLCWPSNHGGIRDNYREATYIGLSIGGCIPIWLGWTLCGLAVAERHRDACLAFGLIATSATVFLVMFMPKGRQLAAMGKEGLYLEDREERCSSLSRTASGYSPSFFHFKPIKYGVMGNNNSGNSTAAAEGGRTGGGSNQNTKHQVIATLGGAQAHRLEMSTEFFVVPPTVATMKPPSIRGVPTSLAGMITEAAGNATPPTIVPTHTIGLRKEGWVVPVLILSIITMITMVGFEVFVLCKVWRTSPSRRHLFLGQMLLLGLFACAGIAAIVTSRPTVVSCAIIRFGSGVAFALVFASLLVKCVFLISINGGVYLPYPYQGLLLLFAVLIQVAVSAQWLLTSPPEVIASPTTRYTILLASNTSPIQQSVHLCHTPFSEHLLSLIYVVFLILFVAVLAIKSRGIRDNYREATYIGLSIGGCIPIWLGWTLCGLAVAERHRDACLAFG